ncbi:MAG: hypothetical protein ACI89T_002558, partial [Cognaticolwellia sp.]
NKLKNLAITDLFFIKVQVNLGPLHGCSTSWL